MAPCSLRCLKRPDLATGLSDHAQSSLSDLLVITKQVSMHSGPGPKICSRSERVRPVDATPTGEGENSCCSTSSTTAQCHAMPCHELISVNTVGDQLDQSLPCRSIQRCFF